MSQEPASQVGALRPGGNKKILKPKLLLGEGADEENFFGALLKHLGKDDVQALSYGGKPKLSSFLDLLMRDTSWPDVEALLITRDADFPRERAVEPAAHTAWKSITDALRARGLPVPDAHGKLTQGPGIRVGVFVLPDGTSDGMLESLVLAAVARDPVTPCLDAYFRCVEAASAGIPPNLLPKARAHAFLASRPVPDTRVGEAALRGYWPWEDAAFAPLLGFVRSA